MKRLDLERKTKWVNISSIKDNGYTIRVKEVKLQIVDLPLGFHSDEK